MNKKEVLEKLHERMIAEIQDYAIILLDIDGTILTWNMGAQRIKGYDESEILGQNFRIFYMPQDRQALLPEKLIDQAKKEGRATHIGRIYKIINKLDPNKMGQNLSKKTLPREGSVTVRNSNHFVDELIEIGDFSKILEE